MPVVTALRGLTIVCFCLALGAMFVLVDRQAALAQGETPAAPDLKIDLPATPATPAKPVKPAKGAGAAKEAKIDAGVTVITTTGDGSVEIIGPQGAVSKSGGKPAAKPVAVPIKAGEAKPVVPADPAPKPVAPANSEGDRAPRPLDAAPATAAAPEAAAPASADKSPTPFDAVPGSPSAPAPAKAAAPLVQVQPSAPTSAPAPAPGPAKAGLKGRHARVEAVAPVAARRLGDIALGALLPLTGTAQARGQAAAAALELAKQDIGEYFAKVGVAGGLTIQVEDTESSPKVALERLKGLAVRGVRVVIGPQSDDEINEVREFAKTNGMLLLSPSSAGPFLAKKEGELMRFAPMDTHQAEAVAGLASQEGADAIVPIWEGDLYGDELVVHLKAHFRNMGGTVLPGVRYRPGTTHFAGHVGDLKNQITQAQKQFKKIVIYYAGRAGIADILREAEKLGLAAYRWYGCDATAMTADLTREESVAELAMTARLVSPRYGETETDGYTALEKRIQDKTREFPGTESVVAYDIAWLAAMTGMICGGLDRIDAVRSALPVTAEHFHGVSGWLALNPDLDRREDWGYDFWMIRKDKGKYYWEKFARYQFQPGGTKQFFIHRAE